VGYVRAQRAGVEGLLPLLHLGSETILELAVAPFRGTFDHTLDAKNRLTVPARYRAALAGGVVLGMPVDLEPCVGVWDPDEYERYSRRALADLPALSPRLTELERFFYGSSQDAELDAAGRIMVPGFLCEHAGLQKEVVVVGAGDRLELWSKDVWNEHRPALLSGVARITADVDNTD
jgi:MraZ protein